MVCELCQIGSYQSSFGATSCSFCSERRTTPFRGAKSEEELKKADLCCLLLLVLVLSGFIVGAVYMRFYTRAVVFHCASWSINLKQYVPLSHHAANLLNLLDL